MGTEPPARIATMQRFSPFDLTELKLVYRALHQHLMQHIALMDAEFMDQLQQWLQYRAGQDGVDIGDHAQWDAWLGNAAVPCETRVAGRTRLGIVE